MGQTICVIFLVGRPAQVSGVYTPLVPFTAGMRGNILIHGPWPVGYLTNYNMGPELFTPPALSDPHSAISTPSEAERPN